MLRNTIIGALVFGGIGALTAYLWTAFEFPFAIWVAAAAGWYAVVRTEFGTRKAWWAALVGGTTFTAVFLMAILFALTDGSPIALSAWASALLAAAVAGGLTGLVFGRAGASLAMAVFSSAGMLAGIVLSGVLRGFAPAAVDVEGPVQFAYFALAQGVVGVAIGAAIGAGVSWVKQHHLGRTQASATTMRPHSAV